MRQDALHRPLRKHPRAPVASPVPLALEQAAAITGVDASTLADWAEAGLVTIDASDVFRIDVRDVPIVRSLCEPPPLGLPPALLRRTLSRLREPRVTLVEREGQLVADDDRPLTLGRIGAAASSIVDWHARGIDAELAGDLATAIDRYRQALRADGPTAQVAFDLAHALAEIGERAGAIERYRQAIEFDAGHADAWINLGDLLMCDGDADAAIDAFRHALALAPDDAAAHYDLADALDEVGRTAQARLHFAAFLRLADGPAAHVAYAASRRRGAL